jgi:cyclophilin family peptidyl-prolyl cis-trans isomerase
MYTSVKKHTSVLLITVGIIFLSLFSSHKFEINTKNMIQIETDYGVMDVKLYDKTPLHTKNMMKLVEQKFYDSLLFHRVIPNFMIQGGDPDSKNADKNKMLGTGGPGYTIPAEFAPAYIHKKGAIAAARLGGAQNPHKESSGSQFYIVQGKTYTDQELTMIENQRIEKMTNELIVAYVNKPENDTLKTHIMHLQKKQEHEQLQSVIADIQEKIEPEIKKLNTYRYTDEQKEVYETIGGTPFLDYEYTVFGEVVDGFEVIDKIGSVETQNSNRPVADITMIVRKK